MTFTFLNLGEGLLETVTHILIQMLIPLVNVNAFTSVTTPYFNFQSSLVLQLSNLCQYHFWFHYIFNIILGSLPFIMVNQTYNAKSSNLSQWFDYSWNILLNPHTKSVALKFQRMVRLHCVYILCILNWKWLKERKRYVDVIVSRSLRVEFQYQNKTGQILAVKFEDEESFGLTENFFRPCTWLLWWHNLWSYLIPYFISSIFILQSTEIMQYFSFIYTGLMLSKHFQDSQDS